MISLRRGIALTDGLVATLQQLRLDLENVSSNPTSRGLLGWAAKAEGQLRLQLTTAEMTRLVRTPRVEALPMDPGLSSMSDWARLEIEDLRAKWATELAEIAEWQKRWKHGVLVSADTNVLVNHPELLLADVDQWHALVDVFPGDWVRVVLPLVIIDELDRLKERPKDATLVRSRTQIIVRRLVELYDHGSTDTHRMLRGTGALDSHVSVEVLGDPPGHRRLERADDEIVDRLCALRDLAHKPVTVLTQDNGMTWRCKHAGLVVRRQERPPDAVLKDRGEAQWKAERAAEKAAQAEIEAARIAAAPDT